LHIVIIIYYYYMYIHIFIIYLFILHYFASCVGAHALPQVNRHDRSVLDRCAQRHLLRGYKKGQGERYWTQDVNGEFPVGGQLPIPVPTGQKFPRPHPRECQRGKFLPHPYPRAGILSPRGPCPRHKIQLVTMDKSESKIQRNNPSKFTVKKNLVHLVCHEIDLVPISENLKDKVRVTNCLIYICT